MFGNDGACGPATSLLRRLPRCVNRLEEEARIGKAGTIAGLCLYYPGHRHVPLTLRAFVDAVRSAEH